MFITKFNRKYCVFTGRLLMLLCWLIPGFGSLQAIDEEVPIYNKITVIASGSAMEGWAVEVVQGIQDVVYLGDYTLVSLRIHYLALNDFKDQEHSRNFAVLIGHEQAVNEPSVYILIGAESIAFYLKWQDEYFQDVPAVFCAVNDAVNDQIQEKNNITGIVDTLSLKDTVDMIRKLHPSTREIIFCGPETEDNRKRFQEVEALNYYYLKSDNLMLSRLPDPTAKSLSTRVEKANSNPVIVSMGRLYTERGEPLPYNSPLNRWERGSEPYQQVPVYSFWISQLSIGAVGGKIFVEREKGKAAAQMALRIIHGEDVNSIPVMEQDNTRYLFNYKAMQRFGITADDLPKGAEILNKPQSFVTLDRNIVWSFGMLMALLVIFIFMLLFSGKQRRRITKELKENHIKLRTLIEHLPERIFMKDHKGEFLLINWSHRPGFDPQMLSNDVIGKTDFDFYPKERAEEFRQEEQLIIKTAQPIIDNEVKTVDEDGTEYWHHISKIPFKNQNGQIAGIIGIIRDVSRRKEEEKELLDAIKSAESANKAKSEFLAMMSHEIRTPMNSVLGFCQILESSPLSEDQKRYLQKIAGAGETLINIIDEILNYSQIEAGQLEIREEDFDVYQAIKQTVDLVSVQARRKGVALELDIATDVPEQVNTDSKRLKQILLNIVGNAVKFTEKGSINIKVRIELPISIKDPHSNIRDLMISVEDTGIGIDNKLRDILFLPFSQADTSSRRKYGGTGLGLAICRRMLLQMGGSIDFSSEAGKGSIFTFYIPVRIPSLSENQSENSENIPVKKENLVNENFAIACPLEIMVVEDNPDNLFFISEILAKFGYSISTALNGNQAIKRFSQKKWDLILMDIQMPEMDGLEATKLIRKLEKEKMETGELTGTKTYIAALTAFALQRDRQLCLEVGMDNFLAKPLIIQELKRILEIAWRQKKKSQS